jgi:hypothetical protein
LTALPLLLPVRPRGLLPLLGRGLLLKLLSLLQVLDLVRLRLVLRVRFLLLPRLLPPLSSMLLRQPLLLLSQRGLQLWILWLLQRLLGLRLLLGGVC